MCNKIGEITNIQKARVIIDSVGEEYQKLVVDLLRSVTWDGAVDKNTKLAYKVIDNITEEYTLNVANVLWQDKYGELPDSVKNW